VEVAVAGSGGDALRGKERNMTMPYRAGKSGSDPNQLARTIQQLEQRVKALEAVIKVSGMNLDIVSSGAIKIKCLGSMDIESSMAMKLKGTTIDLN
jgi:hypothetical protein